MRTYLGVVLSAACRMPRPRIRRSVQDRLSFGNGWHAICSIEFLEEGFAMAKLIVLFGLLSTLTLAAVPGQAQIGAGSLLTLEQAIALAETHNRQLAAADARLDATRLGSMRPVRIAGRGST